MSVERLMGDVVFDYKVPKLIPEPAIEIGRGNGEVAGLWPDPDGDVVRYTDYTRDCIKGRCGGCKNGGKWVNERTLENGVSCKKVFPWKRKSIDGYCDEWEAR
jgi:hypothetical protein